MQQYVRAGLGVMIMRNATVLLGLRHHDPKCADSELHGEGTWTMPGGSLKIGETFEEGACREVHEETGLALDASRLAVVSVSNDKVADAHFVTVGLVYRDDNLGEPTVREPDEIVEWRWFALDQLPKPLFFPSARLAHNVMAGVFYQRSES